MADFPATSISPTAWRLRVWNDLDLEKAWLSRTIISISADEVGDLTVWPPESDLREALTDAKPECGRQAIGQFVTYWRYFRREMAPGDLVAVPLSGSTVGLARITGDYLYDAEEPECRLRHQRQVEWGHRMPRSDLDDDLRKVVNAPGTICRIRAPQAAERLEALIR